MKSTSFRRRVLGCIIAIVLANQSACTHKSNEPYDPAPYRNVMITLDERPRVGIDTDFGQIVLELRPDLAPKHCQSMIYLAEKGFYNSVPFYRVVPGFVIQGGDPFGNGSGGPGYTVPAEFSSEPITDGTLSMVHWDDINSAGSQFFIALGRLSSLDRKYTVFGKVVQGLDVVHTIEKVPCNGERPKSPVYMNRVYRIVHESAEHPAISGSTRPSAN
ncbi:MAG: peptidylprolyl isomerase [candidate division Zixibacteria bacterium]|nr:peptidylprolyl isomerase [candidate division Zixibacteria bacterium]